MNKLKILLLSIPVAILSVTNVYAHEYTEIIENMSDEEYILLEKIVAAESQTENMDGRKAVVEVIFNRVLSDDPYYPDTIEGVLSQHGEFETYPMRNASWVEPEYATEAIEFVLENGQTVLPDTEYLFFSRGKSKYATDFVKINNHWFGKAK